MPSSSATSAMGPAFAGSRIVAKTVWPCRAKSSAVSLPKPDEHPVTSTEAMRTGP